jgi:hypothetical protein
VFYKEELLGCGLWHKFEIVAMGSVCKGKITVRARKISEQEKFRARKIQIRKFRAGKIQSRNFRAETSEQEKYQS